MSPDFRRVDDLFRRGRHLDADARSAFLDFECGSDMALRAEVESLLREHERPGDFLDEPASVGALPPDDARRLPGRIGRYHIIEPLGEGGMGTVYLAEQDGTRRTVAIKLIRGAAFSPALRKRFELEAIVLGRLRHPGIAQVYEAGVHDDPAGPCPFIAMEHVDGVPLSEHLRRRDPGRRERLELFLAICDAVHHANINGVIHRDIKPANILVEERDGVARPKILDFGIARAVDADGTPTIGTELGQLLGTVHYMSPEQAEGDPTAIDVRSDVYALGVLLYEMLAGRLPYRIDGRLMHDSIRAIREDEPVPLGSVDRTFRGDLETILGKALEKPKERRYQSAAELGDDVRRFLADEPISAYPPTAMYQLRKFVRRNRELTVGVTVVAIVLVAGIVATSWQAIAASRARADEYTVRVRAEERLDDVRRLARVFIMDFDSRIEHLTGALPARQLIVATGLEYLDRVAQEAGEDIALDQELATGYIRLGDIQGGRWTSNLGDTAGALETYAKAAALLRPERHEDNSISEALLFRAIINQADVTYEMNRAPEAIAIYEQAEVIARARYAARPDDTKAIDDLSAVLNKRSIALRWSGDPTGALAALEESQALLRDLAGRTEISASVRRSMAVDHFHAGLAHLQAGDREAAEASLSTFLAMSEALAEEHPESGLYQRDVLVGHERLGQVLLVLNRAGEAAAHWETAIEIGARLIRTAPEDATAYGGLVAVLTRIGELELARGDLDAARAHFERCYEAASGRASLDTGNAGAQRGEGVSLYKLGELERAIGRDETREASPRRAALASSIGWFEKCAAKFRAMEANGLLSAGDAGVFDDIAAQIAECEELLAALD